MWIVSFADMVILLMSFFVLLLCQGQQKSKPDDELLKILASVKAGFGNRPSPNSKDKMDIAVLQVLSQRGKSSVVPSGMRWLPAAINGKQVKERDNFLKAQSNVGKPVRFTRDSDALSRPIRAELELVAEVIRHHYRMIVIQGHCSQDEASRDPQEGHDLSFRRGLAVRAALEDYGVGAARMRIVSCGSHEKLNDIGANDHQVVVVTMGSYFLPTDLDVIDETPLDQLAKPEAAKAPAHGGH